MELNILYTITLFNGELIMAKNRFLLFLCAVVISTNAFAVPSVKVLGNDKSEVSVAKPIVAMPKLGINKTAVAKSEEKQATKTSLSRAARMPSSNKLSNLITGNKASKPSKPDSNTKPDVGDVSQGDFDAIVNRIEVLEERTENIITDVVETESGAYVTDVSVDGNKLKVNKTRALYAPIRSGTNGNITGEAEIWIVK